MVLGRRQMEMVMRRWAHERGRLYLEAGGLKYVRRYRMMYGSSCQLGIHVFLSGYSEGKEVQTQDHCPSACWTI
jgi:hypothetical protein